MPDFKKFIEGFEKDETTPNGQPKQGSFQQVFGTKTENGNQGQNNESDNLLKETEKYRKEYKGRTFGDINKMGNKEIATLSKMIGKTPKDIFENAASGKENYLDIVQRDNNGNFKYLDTYDDYDFISRSSKKYPIVGETFDERWNSYLSAKKQSNEERINDKKATEQQREEYQRQDRQALETALGDRRIGDRILRSNFLDKYDKAIRDRDKQTELEWIKGGYSDKYNKSYRALNAELEGKFPATIAAKMLGVPVAKLRSVLKPAEWHHSGGDFYNKIDYYDLEPIYSAIDKMVSNNGKLTEDEKETIIELFR